MNDIMTIARIRQIEKQDQLHKHQLMRQAADAEKAERTRFLMAYRFRSLLNRVAPALAPRLGF